VHAAGVLLVVLTQVASGSSFSYRQAKEGASPVVCAYVASVATHSSTTAGSTGSAC